jgi:hypothetical protein
MPLTTESALRKDKRSGQNRRLDAMQHRHYSVIAAIIAEMPTFAPTLRTQKRSCALSFAEALAVNPNFNRVRFMRACGEELEQ